MPETVNICLDRECPACGFPEIVAVDCTSDGCAYYRCSRRTCDWAADSFEIKP